jgi:hypothetical protein
MMSEVTDRLMQLAKDEAAPPKHRALAATLLEYIASKTAELSDSDKYASISLIEFNAWMIYRGRKTIATEDDVEVLVPCEDHEAPGWLYVNSAPDPPRANGPVITPDSIDDLEFA